MKKNFKLPIEFEHTYYSNNLDQYKNVILALHGYQQSGKFFFNKLMKHFDLSETLLLAPNAPFMVPYKKHDSYQEGYSWYFYDSNNKSFYINYDPSAKLMASFLSIVNPNKLPLSIIGYSQGGFLAPKVAELTDNVEKVIGMASIFRGERFNLKEGVQYSQLHGEQDDIVPMNEAKKEFENLETTSKRFMSFNGDHLMTSSMLKKLEELLK